jgi:hypothetical protein
MRSMISNAQLGGEGRSFLRERSGYCTDLLIHAQKVEVIPCLDNLVVFDSCNAKTGERHLLPGRCHANARAMQGRLSTLLHNPPELLRP